MKSKKIKHSCKMAGTSGLKKRGKRSAGKKADNKALEEIFERYYKNQVAALYRAVGK